MLTGYHSEMGERRPEDTQIEARLSHYGKHWYCVTALELKGRGISLVNADYGNGKRRYSVTALAFKKLCEQFKVSTEMLL